MQNSINLSLTNLGKRQIEQRQQIFALFSQLQQMKDNFLQKQKQKPDQKVEKIEPKKVLSKYPKKQEKKKAIIVEKDLFKRFISRVAFLNIIKFLNIKQILTFRLISKFSNYLVEQNVFTLISFYDQRRKKIEILKKEDLYIPVTRSLYNLQKHLIRLKKVLPKKTSELHPKLFEYISFLFQINISTGRDQHIKNPNQFEKLQSVITGIQRSSQLIDWLNLNENQRRLLKKISLLNVEEDKFEPYQNYIDLKAYLLKLFEFSQQPQYYLICDVNKKDLVLPKLISSIQNLSRLQQKIRAKQDFLPKIQELNKLFFQNVCQYLQFQDIIKLRLVCQSFYISFKENIHFYNHQVTKQLNSIQSSLNMNKFQDEQTNKDFYEPSINELMFSIAQECNSIGQIEIDKFVLLEPRQIISAILMSQANPTIKIQDMIMKKSDVEQFTEENLSQLVPSMLKYYQQQVTYYQYLPKLQKHQLALDKLITHYENQELPIIQL